MSLPTHRVIATGERVFPGGHNPADLELLPANYWADIAFEEAREAKRAEIDAARDAHREKGYSPTTGPLAGYTLQAREKDQNNWNTSFGIYTVLIARGAGGVSGAEFRTIDDQDIIITYEEGLDVLLDMGAWGGAVFKNSWDLKNAVAAATTQAELDAIDPSDGWPS